MPQRIYGGGILSRATPGMEEAAEVYVGPLGARQVDRALSSGIAARILGWATGQLPGGVGHGTFKEPRSWWRW